MHLNCEFKTLHEVGLKIHRTKKHKNTCVICDLHFANEELLDRHKLSDTTLAYMHESSSAEFGLEIRQYLNSESCLGVLSLIKPR